MTQSSQNYPTTQKSHNEINYRQLAEGTLGPPVVIMTLVGVATLLISCVATSGAVTSSSFAANHYWEIVGTATGSAAAAAGLLTLPFAFHTEVNGQIQDAIERHQKR